MLANALYHQIRHAQYDGEKHAHNRNQKGGFYASDELRQALIYLIRVEIRKPYGYAIKGKTNAYGDEKSASTGKKRLGAYELDEKKHKKAKNDDRAF